MAEWVKLCPVHQKIAHSIPIQGTYLCCMLDPWLGAYGI